MATPTEKSPTITNLLDRLSPAGRKHNESIQQDICVWCGGAATEFKDELSRKEYRISGFCQSCQDEVFEEHVHEPSDEPEEE